MIEDYIDLNAIEGYVNDAGAHYEESAPAIAKYLDNFLSRLYGRHTDVTLFEMINVFGLREADVWMTSYEARLHISKTLNTVDRDSSVIWR